MKVNKQDMREKIIRAVKRRPELADDDKLLIAVIWYMEGWHDPALYDKLKKVSSPETIRRTRAKLVEEGVITLKSKTTQDRQREIKTTLFDLGYYG